MNNPKSVLYGWAALTAAGAFAYYIAKQEIDARRKEYDHKQEILTWEQKIAKDEKALSEKKAKAGSPSVYPSDSTNTK